MKNVIYDAVEPLAVFLLWGHPSCTLVQLAKQPTWRGAAASWRHTLPAPYGSADRSQHSQGSRACNNQWGLQDCCARLAGRAVWRRVRASLLSHMPRCSSVRPTRQVRADKSHSKTCFLKYYAFTVALAAVQGSGAARTNAWPWARPPTSPVMLSWAHRRINNGITTIQSAQSHLDAVGVVAAPNSCCSDG
jgi:hypothetical protein